MTLETESPEQAQDVFDRARAGLLVIHRMARGKTNCAWRFDVTARQPEGAALKLEGDAMGEKSERVGSFSEVLKRGAHAPLSGQPQKIPSVCSFNFSRYERIDQSFKS